MFINKKSNRNLRFFLIYTSVSLTVMVPMVLMVLSRFKIINYNINFSFADSINNYSLLFNYLFLSVFLIFSMPGYKLNKLIWVLFFVFFGDFLGKLRAGAFLLSVENDKNDNRKSSNGGLL